MKNSSVQQLKDAMVELYPRKDELGCIAYRIAFGMLEEKLSDEEIDRFLDAYGM